MAIGGKGGEQDEIDFKPFFDMIVGVLFVLLILIAAQMFFTQWGDAEPAREAEQRRIEARNRQVTDFLEALAEDLRARGLPAGVDREAVTVALPLDRLTAVDGAGRPSVRPDAAAALGASLGAVARCLPGQPAGPTPARCPVLDQLRLGQAVPVVALGGAPSPALGPDRYGRLLSTLLGAALVGAAPDLLALRGGAGPALPPHGEVIAGPEAGRTSALRGDYVLRFTFDPP